MINTICLYIATSYGPASFGGCLPNAFDIIYNSAIDLLFLFQRCDPT